ncbi:MAG: flagellar assembly protein FliW [Synergistaceae bacterium]|jgi:flagellar assembly factor FliW|nr:flagellar assembly protein FliW [Synergistaceae bacterium]
MDHTKIARSIEITTLRFGEILYAEEDILFFPRGLPAFENNCSWILTGEEDNAIKWLQSIEDGRLAVPVTTPDAVLPDYNAKIPEDELDAVGSRDSGELALLVVASIPASAPWNMTVNLRAPILVSLKTRKAVQVIALGDEYPIHYAVFPENAKRAMQVAAAAGAEV